MHPGLQYFVELLWRVTIFLHIHNGAWTQSISSYFGMQLATLLYNTTQCAGQQLSGLLTPHLAQGSWCSTSTTSALTCSRSNGLATHYNSTCTCIYIHSSMPQQLNIESTESLSCTVSGTSIRIKSAVGVVAQLCTCRNDGYRLQQFNKVQEHVRLPC